MALRAAGLDLGSTHLKAVCVDLDPGGPSPVAVRALRRAKTPDTADDLVAIALRLMREVVDEGGAVDAIGIASMAETGVPLDGRDRPLTPLLRWDTSRPEPALDIAPAELFARTGVRLSPKVPLATWAWLGATHPETQSRMRRWAGVADLVAFELTGRLATDHTLAGRTGAYRLHDGGYDAELLALVGLDAKALPEVTEADEPVGLANGVPVTVAGHDHQVGAHVCGVTTPGDVANSLGTAEVLLRVLTGRADPERVRAAGMSLVRSVGGEHALLAGVGASGATYAAWLDEHGPNDLPALFEDLAAQTRRVYDEQLALDPAHPPHTTVTLLGGPGAHDPAWTAIKADALPAELRVVDQQEPVAVGAAVVAAERAGLVATSSVVVPTTPWKEGTT